jgi:hypothetical protein
MLFFTLKTIFVSLLLIALIHYLYGFFKNTLTVPKVKDLVNKPAERYNKMFAGINDENDYRQVQEQDRNRQEQDRNRQEQPQQQQQNVVPQNMQAELNNFLNELKKPMNVAQNAMTQNAMTQNVMTQNSMTQNAITTSTIDASNNNFPAANESAFGSYTPF